MVVIDTQATANIDVLHYDVMSLQLVLQLVDAVAESLEVTHVKYLTTNVEVKSQELDVLHFCSFLDDALHIAHGDTELVLCQTGCDVGMSMSAHIMSLENKMACGVGACLCCVEKTTEGNQCVCKDGPVINIKKLTWDI